MKQLVIEDMQQWITTIGDKSIWTLSFDKMKLFNETSTRSLYYINQHSKVPVTSDSPIILDDDINLFNRYLELAIADLTVLLTRRIPQSKSEYPKEFDFKEGDDDSTIINTKDKLEYNLLMSVNHDKSMLSPLVNYCRDFLVCRVLEKWYNVDFGSYAVSQNIVHTLEFRRKSPARKVRPLL